MGWKEYVFLCLFEPSLLQCLFFFVLFLLILIYRGTGLGKNADGITESIQVKRREENEGVCEILFIDGK